MAKQQNDEQVESNMTKTLRRTGECGAIVCAAQCGEFAYHGNQDGWRLCACGHTQNIHRIEEQS